MSDFPPTSLCVENNQTFPMRYKQGMLQHSGQMLEGVSLKASMEPCGSLNQGSSPLTHGTEPMVLNQPTPAKRTADNRNSPTLGKGDDFFHNIQVQNSNIDSSKKKKKLIDKILPQNERDNVAESQAYMDLLAFEKNLDSSIMKKRLDIQEALKCPAKQKHKLRMFISNTFYPAKKPSKNQEESVASWELRIEGLLLEDIKNEPNKVKRKFSSFFKSLIIEFDKDICGPNNHLVEWHRTSTTQETDGFQVKRLGSKNVRCTILLLLDYQPQQFKLDKRLARLLGVHTQTRPFIIKALWQFIKTRNLQDSQEKEYINCDKYLKQIFNCSRMKFDEVPQRLNTLLYPPDPIVINHIISVKKRSTVCYDIDVEVNDTLKTQMNNFLLSTVSQQELLSLDNKIHETVETINQLKTNREFFLSFAKDPEKFIHEWIVSQTSDLQTMTDVAENQEGEHKTEFHNQLWTQEAVSRYIYFKAQQKQKEIEHKLDIYNS